MGDDGNTHTTDSASTTSRNLPPPPHGCSTRARSPPVSPSSNAAAYAGSRSVISAAPRISEKHIGRNSPKNVSMKILVEEVSTGSLQL